ncbi:hypothetical protein HPP92_026047 [Vanilla planifolia]|uniref:Pectinesterase inhibitor domain-containing protein n=1 Tax=Vanilla planifolia TaxID=51239 RepID=A0A835PEV9_VANPL|nr:hypothetical protein HPP92_026320 [Vanilla planifolia]KAG0451789.1 hypothetical protein HPP92_026047 [Vanilla planifolia]
MCLFLHPVPSTFHMLRRPKTQLFLIIASLCVSEREDDSMSMFYFIALHLLPSVTATAGEADAVAATCNLTLYFDVCSSSLRSDQRNRGADLRGLVDISVDLSVAHAKGTVVQLRKMKAQSSPAAGGRGKKMALGIADWTTSASP